ncbi:gastric triacylglycerol lipase-like [Parasteatoda tepidariorum]|uniref:gastric triacylglycerol lipase-like n=1 Tax=Parasteatoda tepidariorum TaxID=114398 RepID=UPI001C719164|nr:gastric triacylglycerol lipase-like [Parasteatoda tepidariorum]
MRLLCFLVTVFMLLQVIFSNDIPKNDELGANSSYDPDLNRNVSELISTKGYPVENHIVQTEDGFLLSVQRIPYGLLNKKAGNRKPVLLQHGFLGSSSDWVINFPHQSLGFILADSGYDVWLGNTRGNTYSRNHISLDPNCTDFWRFSFDEMAEFDLPAMIDYILDETKAKSLSYIGHSQGTTVAFALLSEKPIYNEKINLFVALAPEVEVSHGKGVLSLKVAKYNEYMEGLFKMFGINEVFPNGPVMKSVTNLFCNSNVFNLCENFVFTLSGIDREQFNKTRLPVYMAHYPNGASTKNFLHYFQMAVSQKFRKYDHKRENRKHYKQDTPPEYDVSKIKTPTAIFWGMNDALLDPEDISILEKKLKSSLIYSYCIPWKDFNHIDFLIAKDARELVYDHILNLLRNINADGRKLKLDNFFSNRELCQ